MCCVCRVLCVLRVNVNVFMQLIARMDVRPSALLSGSWGLARHKTDISVHMYIPKCAPCKHTHTHMHARTHSTEQSEWRS
jgi:hypothetical protein